MLAQAENEIASLAKLDESQKGSLESLADARFRLEDLAGHLREYAEAAESDPARLSEVEDRLDLIRNLKKKHGGTIEEILDAWEQYDKRLKSLVNREAEIAALEKRLAQAESSLAAAAGELSAKRQTAARRFEKNLQSELAQLQMENAKFSVSIWREEAPEGQGVEFEGRRYFVGPDGVDRLEFLLSANPGEALKPLKRIASGGELSRIMLAIKSLLAQRDGIPTLIFDEIDVGISGATAQVVAEKMRRIADGRQVVCITHLAQIAARASQHFAVEKKKKGKRIVTQVRPLSEPERVEEIARLLGGDAESAVGKKHAQELLRGMNAAAS
jgi:DNA repair protein RecN (Recombination protein N)